MDNFVKSLAGKKFEQGEDLESEALIVAQKVLVNEGMDFIPHSYSSFLKVYNGIKRDGAYLFGATIDDDFDIIDKNKEMIKPKDSLLLGYNEFDLLVFNYKIKKYQIVDREDFDIIDEYNEDEISYALGQIFNV